MKNYYAILGIRPDASEAEIKNAYRQNAKRYHPDLHPKNEAFRERFMLIKLAYETLENPTLRKKYDAELLAARNAKEKEQTAQATAMQAEMARKEAQKQQSQAFQSKNQHASKLQSQQAVNAAIIERNKQTIANVARRLTNLELQKQKVSIDELKQMHTMQLELSRIAAKEELLKFKKQATERLKKFKQEFDEERLKQRKNYEKSINELTKKLQAYKSGHKKASFNAGFKEGMKSARESSQTTINELKELLNSQSMLTGEKQAIESAVQIKKLQLEISLLNETNRELMQQIKLAEQNQIEHDKDSSFDSLNHVNDQIDELICERDSLKLLLNEYEDEINFLNEEILHLEGFVNMWRDVSSDSIITDEEVALIEHYENSQCQQARETYYGDLGLYLNALPEEIETAFKRLSRRYQNKDAYSEKLSLIVKAYNVLSDPIQKRAYDMQINNETDI